MNALQLAFDKAKVRLMSKDDSVFFTTVCFSLKHKWDSQVSTACTNGLEIRYNPDFFQSLDIEEQVFLLLHESMHVAYLHMERLQDRDPMRWNVAADHVINLQLIERGFRMPKGGLADRKYKGLGTEEVYKLLKDEDIPESGDYLDLEAPPSDAPEGDLRREVEDILVRASLQSKMANDKPGTIPADIQIFLNGLLNPKLPWYQILRKFFNAMTKNDYSWRRPNRRFFPTHYLPGLWSEKLMNIAIAVDASGSVSDEDFHQFVSEIHQIMKTLKPDRITLVQFDARLRSVDEVRGTTELMAVTFTGRGGTLIEPVLEWAKESKPQVLLVFTDGEFRINDNSTNPGMPIVWLIHNNPHFEPHTGKVIHYELENT